MKFQVRVDTDIFSLQDFSNDKTIKLTNQETKSKLKISYVSLDDGFYVFLDTINSKKVLKIADKFAGQNTYDFSTLKLLGTKDCFNKFGGCGGFNDSRFTDLGEPHLIYDHTGFHH